MPGDLTDIGSQKKWVHTPLLEVYIPADDHHDWKAIFAALVCPSCASVGLVLIKRTPRKNPTLRVKKSGGQHRKPVLKSRCPQCKKRQRVIRIKYPQLSLFPDVVPDQLSTTTTPLYTPHS